MVRVSGVPYEVELVDMVSELERENAMMRARMQRLEDENRTLDALVFRLNTELMNLKNGIR
jgi:predicted nuclease with TOPRIM domain